MINNELKIKLEIFESALWDSYKRTQEEEHTIWVSLHKVIEHIGLSRALFNKRLDQLWKCQFSSNPIYVNKYTFGLEADATPVEYYRLRNKLIMIDGTNMKIIQMDPKNI